MPRRAATDPAAKSEALRLAESVGAAEASRQTGVPAATIRAWRSRAGGGERPAGIDPVDWRVAQERTASSASAIAAEAIESARQQLREGRTLKAQQSMIAAGIALDKLAGLEVRLEALNDQQAKLGARQGELVAAVIVHVLDVVGVAEQSPTNRMSVSLGSDSAFGRLVSDLLRQAGRGEGVLAVSPSLEAECCGELEEMCRRRFGDQLRAEVVDELRREGLARPALPAPAVVEVPEEVVEDESELAADVEVVQGEVVRERPVRRPPPVRFGQAGWREAIVARQLGAREPLPRIETGPRGRL